MIRILVTGPIGSGKSEVCRYLSLLGYPCFDCDSACKELYENVPGLKSRIEDALGIDFRDVAVIFTDKEKREALESIVYPILLDRIRQWLDSQSGRIAFIESAVAMDKPVMDGIYDKVLMVTAGRSVRAVRNPQVALRDNLQSFDLSRIDFVIENNGELEALHNSIDNYLRTL